MMKVLGKNSTYIKGGCSRAILLPGQPTISEGPTALVVGAGRGCLSCFLFPILNLLSPSDWETAR